VNLAKLESIYKYALILKTKVGSCTGKTITSLNCLYEIYDRKGYYKAIILVPTVTLVNQWEEECRKFRFNNIVKVFSKNPFWQDEIDRICFNEKYQTDDFQSYIIISTYASYSRPKVFEKLNSLDKRRVLLIADEAHNMGAESMAKKLKDIPYARRIGLSATPERQFDESGNAKLRKFFGAEEAYTFEYSMDEAIHGANPVLCKYYYYPHVIRLTDDEMAAYIELSEKISKYFNYDTETFTTKDEILKRLLLARKRIIHKAANKLPAFREIIQKRFEERGNLNYTLVYVPEGLKPDYFGAEDDFDKSDIIGEDVDTDRLINEYTACVLNVDGHVTVRKFVSGQKDREELLRNFATAKVQVLTSMKCLDEGVDVPRSELAIFCSSTGNPRQFIQRRGRVLRKHPEKEFAILHDLVVVPEVGSQYNSYKMERSLLQSELSRVKNFADMSENPSYSEMELRSALDYYALNL
jgi:superfamily II DNA or RNA helicase